MHFIISVVSKYAVKNIYRLDTDFLECCSLWHG